MMKNRKLMVYLENAQDAIPVTYKLRMLLRRAILEALDYEGVLIRDVEVSMTFTDNEGIRELNREHRNIDRPTDVLSFPMFEADEEPQGAAVGFPSAASTALRSPARPCSLAVELSSLSVLINA